MSNYTREIDNLTKAYSDYKKKLISKAGYDKTLIGFVSEKVENENGSYYWVIQVEGAAYKIKPERCNITEIGQRVRLFVPNHDYKNKYAEVINEYSPQSPVKISNRSDGDKDIITETWKRYDNSTVHKEFSINYENRNTENERIASITYPDGSVMELEGF